MIASFSNRSAAASYGLYYTAQYVLLGFQLPFFAGWLSLRGFTAAEIGLATGASLMLRLVFGPAIAFWADHQDDERRPLWWVTAVFAFGGLLLVLSGDKLVIAAAVVIIGWSFGLLVPLTDTAVMRADRNGHLHYGQTRAIGSIAFLITTIVGGLAITRFGPETTALAMAIAASMALCTSLVLPRGAGGRGGVRPLSWREAPRLMRSPVFMFVLLASAFAQGAHGVYYAFSYLRWDALGYSPTIIGFLWAIAVVAEVIVLTKARGLAKRLGPMLLIVIGALGTVVRWAVTAAEPPLVILFVIQTMHALTFAATYLGAIEFLDRATPTRLINTGMTLISTTGVGAMTGLTTVIGGFVWTGAGASVAYLLMASMGIMALIAAIIAARLWRGDMLFD